MKDLLTGGLPDPPKVSPDAIYRRAEFDRRRKLVEESLRPIGWMEKFALVALPLAGCFGLPEYWPAWMGLLAIGCGAAVLLHPRLPGPRTHQSE